jgi:hypothetical protein
VGGVLKELEAITGSLARAAVLEELVVAERPRSATDVTRGRRVQLTGVRRELERLVAAGLVRRSTSKRRDHSHLFEMETAYPGFPDLRRAVLVIAGPASVIRGALLSIDQRQLSWIHGPYAEGPASLWQIRVVVITSRGRQVREALARLMHQLEPRMATDVMSISEWVTRLQTREMRIRAIRRAIRMWLIGSDVLLRRAERREIETRALWKAAMQNWRDEYEWDEDYDPFSADGTRRVLLEPAPQAGSAASPAPRSACASSRRRRARGSR